MNKSNSIVQVKDFGIDGVLLSDLLESKDYTTNEKIVLAQSILYSGLGEFNGMGKGCFFRSNKDFSNDCGLAVSSFLRAVLGLIKKGLMKRRTGSREGERASEYRIPSHYADMNPLLTLLESDDFEEDFDAVDGHGDNINVDVKKNGPHIQIHKDIKKDIHKQIDIKNNIENDNKKDIHKQIDIKNNIEDDIKKEKKDDILIDKEDDNKIIIECNIEDKATAVGSLEAPTATSTFDKNVYDEILEKYIDRNRINRRGFWQELAETGKVYFDEARHNLKTNDIKKWLESKEIRESIMKEKGWE